MITATSDRTVSRAAELEKMEIEVACRTADLTVPRQVDVPIDFAVAQYARANWSTAPICCEERG